MGVHGIEQLLGPFPNDPSLFDQPDLARHPLGGMVVRVDDGDQASQPQHVAGPVPAGCRRLGGVTVAPQLRTHVVAELDVDLAFDRLRCEPAVTDKRAVDAQGEQPEAMAVLVVQALVPLDPAASARSFGRG